MICIPEGEPPIDPPRLQRGFAAGGHSPRWFVTSHDKHSPSAQYFTPFGAPNTINTDTRSFVDLQFEPTWQNFESLTRVHFDQYHYSNNLPYPPDPGDGGS